GQSLSNDTFTRSCPFFPGSCLMMERSRFRTTPGLAALALAMLLAWPDRAGAQYTDPPAPAAYALKDVTVVHADGRRAEGVTLVIRGAFIEALGPGVEIPPDAQLLEGDSLVVYPGLIDLHGGAKYEFPRVEVDRSRVQAWSPPRDAQGFTPHRRVVDHLTSTGPDLRDQRRQGVVAGAVLPTDALAPGRGAFLIYRADAATPMELVHTPALGPVLSLRGGRGVYPATLFAVQAFYRQAFEDAARHRTIRAEYARDPRGVPTPAYDPDHEVLQAALDGELPVYFPVDRAEDIRRVLDLSERYGLRPVIVGGEEAWRVADRLKQTNVPVLVSVDFPKPERWKPDEEADTATAASAAELDPAVVREKERIENAYANAGRLARVGVRFALTSGGGEGDVHEGVRKAIEYGLSEADALRALTITPAELIGATHLARIEAGLPANLVVTRGPIFGKGSRVAYTFVEGVLEKGDTRSARSGGSDAPAGSLGGSWSVEFTAPEGSISGEMELDHTGDGFQGTVTTAEFGTFRIRGGSVSGEAVDFTLISDFGGEVVELRFTGTVRGDVIEAKASSPFGPVDMKARRRSGPGGGR